MTSDGEALCILERAWACNAWSPRLKVPLPDKHKAEGYRRFLRVCGWAQVASGPHPVRLPRPMLALYFGVNKITVGIYIRWAECDGFLAHHRPGRHNRHSAFYFNVGRVPELAERAAEGTQEAYDAAAGKLRQTGGTSAREGPAAARERAGGG